MSRKEKEEYVQDRLGNSRRRLDEVRAQDGMDLGDGSGDGLVEVAAADADGASDLLVLELPEDASGFHLNEIHAHNSGDAEDTFSLFSATLDENGNVDTTTRRSVPMNVGAGVSRTIPYEGKEFGEEAVVVTANFEGFIGVGGKMDIPEYNGSSYEQTQAP